MAMAGDESGPSLYRVLLDRFGNLEASHANLREELQELLNFKEKRNNDDESEEEMTSDYVRRPLPGHFNEGGPYRSVLESMGHALHVCTASSEEIIYWNHSAEILFGWKDYEVLGHRVDELLVADVFLTPHKKIMEQLASGQSWSGQFPFKKRSGEIFMAIVTSSPLYEDGELAGFVTVSSDAAIFNSINTENTRPYQNSGKMHGLNLKKIQWHLPRPQIAPVPHLALSVSNLASKLLQRRQGNDMSNSSEETLNSNLPNEKSTTAGSSSGKDESAFEFGQPSKIAARVLAKLHIRETGNNGGEDDGRLWQNGGSGKSFGNEIEPNYPRDLDQHTTSSEFKEESARKRNSSLAAESAYCNSCEHRLQNASEEISELDFLRESNDFRPSSRHRDLFSSQDVNELEIDGRRCLISGESVCNHESLSSEGDNESNFGVDCEILWEDLQLGEEIGQGSYAVVYRGIWNGSDVAVKVYFGSEYIEGTLQKYKKEIGIMKKLRHPNVLLFMGAAVSQERLAIVTEFLPRGSLFKILHKNSQTLDVRRRLRMALDVARGMNYLHHRNPPIVHRDLKSSNLLVDRSWTVKVGDFGLSSLKNATYLTAKSGRGTPQWMAPEVLRNEPSNEKSDVYSFGVVLWELVTVSIPWNNLNSLQVVGVVGFMDRRLELPEGLNPKLASIIRDCWQSDPNQRPSFQDITQRMSALLRGDAAAAAVEKNSEA